MKLPVTLAVWPIQRTVWLGVCVALLSFGWSAHAEAQAKKVAPQTAMEGLQQSISNDDAMQASEFLDRVFREGSAEDRAYAQLLAGRVALMHGDTKAFRLHAAKLRREQPDENASQLLQAYEAWALAIDGQLDEARTALDALLKSQSDYPSTGDVAEILANVHVLRKDADGVKQAVAFGRTFLAYHGESSPYLESLFRRRLAQAAALGKDPADPLFVKAETARRAKKWSAAAVLYERVCREHPASPLGHPSGFWLGECLRLDGRVPRSVHIWQQFIEKEPRGPWRGQAHVGIIDVALEHSDDLPLAKAQLALALAAAETPLALPAAASWDAAVSEIHLRRGFIELIQDRCATAADAFRDAKASVQTHATVPVGGLTPADLDRLIAIADAKSALVPADAVPQKGNISTRLALGCAYAVVNRIDKVRELLEPVAKGKSDGALAGQRSYAVFVLARAEESRGERSFSDAVTGYRQSLQASPKGSWRPEALHRQALLVEQLATVQDRSGQSRTPKTAAKASPSTAAAREQARRTQRVRDSAHLQSLSEALPGWRELIQEYPNSPRVEPALFHAGKVAAATDRDQEALNCWKNQLERTPDGVYAGMCHVGLVRLQLEKFFDLSGAEVHVNEGLAWYLAREGRGPALGLAGPTTPIDWPPDASLQSDRDIGYELHLYAGLVAYLNGDREKAAEMFRQAIPLAPELQVPADSGQPQTATARLMAVAQANRDLVPQEVIDGADQGKLCLQLAACYYAAEEYDRVLELTERAIGKLTRIDPQQRAWAWFLHGRAYHGKMLPLDALDDFRRALAEAPAASWAPQCQFYVANSTFSYEKDIPTAVAEWQQLARRFPKSAFAERAAYHVGVAQQVAGQFKAAQQSYESFVKTYPTSPFVRPIQTYHLPQIQVSLGGPP